MLKAVIMAKRRAKLRRKPESASTTAHHPFLINLSARQLQVVRRARQVLSVQSCQQASNPISKLDCSLLRRVIVRTKEPQIDPVDGAMCTR